MLKKELEEIAPEKSPFESKLNKELDHCLFFKKEEVTELMGHYVKFYPNGVLLVIQDKYKDFSRKNNPDLKYESKSFIFYNNEPVENAQDKEPIFKIHNRNWKSEVRELQPPVKDVDVKVYEHYLYVTEIIDGIKKEYLVDVLTGKPEPCIMQEADQLAYDI